MKSFPPIVVSVLCLFLLYSCGSSRRSASDPGRKTPVTKRELPAFEHEILSKSGKPVSKKERTRVLTKREEEGAKEEHIKLRSLYDFVDEWEGTPHRMGGNTQRGVDCSGFVIQVYQNIYDLSFKGRRAEDLFSETTAIKKEELREGDLVFFKINGRRIDHVGVYLENGKFAHASSSRGVMISHLEENYYQKRFFMGGRVKF